MSATATPLDLSTLTVEELDALSNKARTLAHERRQREHEQRQAAEEKERKALLKSDKYQRARQKCKELRQKLRSVIAKSGRGSFTVLVPIEIKYSMYDIGLGELRDWDTNDPIEVVEFDKSGKLGPSDTLTKTQRAMLGQPVKEYVDRACSEIMRLAPPGTLDEVSAVIRECRQFLNRLQEDEIAFDDVG